MRLAASAAIWASLASVSVRLSAQDVALAADRTISVSAQDAPLGRVLREFERVRAFATLKLDANSDALPVTISTGRLPFIAALNALLRAANVDYLLTGDDGRMPHVLIVRSRTPLAQSPIDNSTNRGAAVTETQTPVVDGTPNTEVGDDSNRQLITDLTSERIIRQPGSFVQLPFVDAQGAPVSQMIGPDDSGLLPLSAQQPTMQIDAPPVVDDSIHEMEGTNPRRPTRAKPER